MDSDQPDVETQLAAAVAAFMRGPAAEAPVPQGHVEGVQLIAALNLSRVCIKFIRRNHHLGVFRCKAAAVRVRGE